jgi:hypothetical protein
VIGARDQHLAGLERLAQRIQRLLREFRTYVASAPTGGACE